MTARMVPCGAAMTALILCLGAAPPAMAQTGAGQSGTGQVIYVNCEKFGLLTIDTGKSEVNNRPARINATLIEWDSGEGQPADIGNGWTGHAQSKYQLDRVQGTLSTTMDMWEVDPSGHEVGRKTMDMTSYTCQKADAPATKF